jgi:hypothetical protein
MQIATSGGLQIGASCDSNDGPHEGMVPTSM